MNNEQQTIELNKENSIELIKRFLDIGYKNGNFSIEQGAVLHKAYRIVKGLEEDNDVSINDAFKLIFDFIDLANKDHCYTLDDVSVIATVAIYIKQNVLVDTSNVSSASSSSSTSGSSSSIKLKPRKQEELDDVQEE